MLFYKYLKTLFFFWFFNLFSLQQKSHYFYKFFPKDVQYSEIKFVNVKLFLKKCHAGTKLGLYLLQTGHIYIFFGHIYVQIN